MYRLSQRGFTIIEMLVATAVASLIMILVVSFLINTLVNSSVDTARADLLREAQLSIDAMSRDIRLSANVDANNRWADANAPNAPTDPLSWEADDDTLILAIAAQDANKDILFDDAVHYITHKNNAIYFVENGNLYKRTLAGPIAGNAATTTCPKAVATTTCPADRELIQGITSLSIRYYDGNDVEVTPDAARSVETSISLSKNKYGRVITATYSTRTVFRNE